MNPSFTYDPTENAVFWQSTRLSPESCETLLDIFDREGAVRPFLELYDAHLKAGGIARITSLRSAA